MVEKMYPVKKFRRRQTVRLAAMAVAVAVSARSGSLALAQDNTFIGSNFASWIASNASIWTGGVPASGQTVDIFKFGGGNASGTLIYTLSSGPDLKTLQISGAVPGASSTLSLQSGTVLATANLYLGAGATSNSNGGPGILTQTQGAAIVAIDPGTGLVSVDSVSTYSLGAGGFLNANSEQLNGTFQENGGNNTLTSGSILTNNGLYNVYNSGTVGADNIVNSGVFNQASGASVSGTTGATSSPTSFTNNGTYLYTGGNFNGSMTNNIGALVSISTAAIPFSQGIINNGQMNVNSSGLNASTGTYAGPITGGTAAGNMVFNGTGVTTLTGSNFYTGSTSIVGGTLVLAGPVGTAGNNFGGSLQGPISVGSAGSLQTTAASQIANGVQLTVNGGNVNLEGTDQTVGSFVMTGGQIQTTGVGLGVATGQVSLTRNSATIIGGLRSSNTLAFNIGNNSLLTVTGPISGYNATAGLMLTGGGTLSIYGTSPLSTIDVQQGILQISEGGTFNGSNISTTVEAGGTLSVGAQPVTIGDLLGGGTVSSLGNGSLTVNSIAGSTFAGTIVGSGGFIKSGAGTLILTGTDASAGPATVNTGVLTVATTGTLSGSLITVATGATFNLNGLLSNTPSITTAGTVNFAASPPNGVLSRSVNALSINAGQFNLAPASSSGNRVLLIANTLNFSGATDAWTGQLDLANNDMDVVNGSLTQITNQIKSGYNPTGGGNWKGTGITSSTAAADTTHLTALGVAQNDNGSGAPLYGLGSGLGTFDGTNPSTNDVLIKYTYVGDANLDGKVDGSDYSRIDNGFLNNLTGWYNGDFNYDGVVNGSDYTLIDNAFNTQGAAIADIVATSTAQIAQPASVPEPASGALLTIPMLMLLKRRRAANAK